jgi:hypothetical protein
VPPSDVSHEVEHALERRGIRFRDLVVVSPPNPHKRGRAMFRVDLEDGGTIKARRLETAGAAGSLIPLRARAPAAFAPAIASHGPVLLEAWIPGTVLVELDPDARVVEAGALLARLHATPLAEPRSVETTHWHEQALADLTMLTDAGRLDPSARERLRAELTARNPGRVRATLMHWDFCAENMLIDDRGALHVIDNEWLTIDAPGFDLARTLCRWPMSPSAWAAFMEAYRTEAAHDPGPLGFWKIVAAAMGARVRIARAPTRGTNPLALLHQLAAHPSTLDDPT